MIDRMIEKFGKKKLFFIMLTSILIIVFTIAGAKEYQSMHFKIGDQGFIYEKTENRKTFFLDEGGLSLIAFAEGFGTSITSHYQDVVIQYNNQTIKTAIDHESEESMINLLTTDSNGTEIILVETELTSDEVIFYKELMFEVIEKSIYFQNGLLTYKFFIFIFFSLIISGFMVYPESVWFFQHMLSVKRGEPTEFYIVTTRITGVILSFLLIRIAFL